jgi:Meiotically up-regulated gene 113
MAVYFVQAGDGGPVKIGFAEDVTGRILELQAGNHLPLIVRRIVPGSRLVEAWLHRRFSVSRIRGEWFAHDADMDSVAPPHIARATAPANPDPALAEIEAFLADTGMTPTAFGREALGDPGFVFGLRSGRDCRRSTLARASAQIAHYQQTGEFMRRPTPLADGAKGEAA